MAIDSSSANTAPTKHIKSGRNLGGVTAIAWGTIRRGGNAAVWVVIVVAGLLAGTGWCYVLRGLHWLRLGPRIADALPLLQLANSDGQPLVRVAVAWLLAGALSGIALAEVAPLRRVPLAFGLALVVLLLASQASYALARNVAFSATVFARSPGLGPVLEACLFALGCWLPRPLDRGQRPGPGPGRRSLVSRISGFDDRGVGSSQSRDDGQHPGDRQPVQHAGGSARA
jgi:hypothetical protein